MLIVSLFKSEFIRSDKVPDLYISFWFHQALRKLHQHEPREHLALHEHICLGEKKRRLYI